MHCGETLTWTERGWVHPAGGGYAMRCDRCGHRAAPYPSPKACPACGAVREWRDDHAAAPDYGGGDDER
jgi:rubrerythrin